MSSIARVLAALGVALVAVGGVAAGYGVYEWRTDTCVSGSGLTAFHVGPNESVEPSFERVAYENLSAAERRVFEAAVGNGSTGVVENRTALDALNGKVVEHRGERYETVVWVADCARGYAAFVVYGGLTAGVGGVVAGATAGWRRLRR